MMRGWITPSRLMRLAHLTPNKINTDILRDVMRKAGVKEHGKPDAKRVWFKKTAALEHLPEVVVAVKAIAKQPSRVGAPQPNQARARRKLFQRRRENGAMGRTTQGLQTTEAASATTVKAEDSEPIRILVHYSNGNLLLSAKDAREIFRQLFDLFSGAGSVWVKQPGIAKALSDRT